MSSAADRNLLFGILALQLDFITREQLVAGMHAWVLAKDKSLADILQSTGALAPARRQLLDPLVDEHIQQHSHNPQHSLAAVSSIGSLKDELSLIADDLLAETIQHLATAPRAANQQTTAPPPGEGNSSRFRVVRLHAQGGLGKVFVARDQELNREVALKEIQPKYADDKNARARFTLEAEITGGLEHPGVVPVYGLGTYADGRPFYAMRFIKGDSLKHAIDRYHQPPPHPRNDSERALELRQLLGRFIDVCQAIEYAHSRGVLHRDLKPGNIMLGKYGETLVVDWGLAKPMGERETADSWASEGAFTPASGSSVEPTQMGAMVGTLLYMSPEQAAGHLDALGPATDVFSLGATLYHVLTGQPPYHGIALEELLAHVKAANFPPPHQIQPDLAPELEAICLKALARDPAARYPSAQALITDLEHWLADEPTSARRDTAADRFARFLRRHRAWALACGAALVLVAVVSAAAGLLVETKRREAAQLAKDKSQLAFNEAAAHAATERELRVSTALRLASRARNEERRPVLATLLAAAAFQVAQETESHAARLESEQALRDQLSRIGGRPCLRQAGAIKELALSADGRWLATRGDDSTAYLCDLQSADPATAVRALPGHTEAIQCLAIGPDSQWLVTGSRDKTLRLWDLKSPNPAAKPRILRGHLLAVHCAAFSPDGRWLISGSDDGVARLWDLQAADPTPSASTLAGHEDGILCLAVSADSRWLVTGSWDQTARVWDLQAERPAHEPRVLRGHQGKIHSLSLSQDGHRLATGSADETVRIWQLSGGAGDAALAVLHAPADELTCLPRSFAGNSLVTGNADGTANVWNLSALDAPTVDHHLRGHEASLTATAISQDGRWLATSSADHTARLWDLHAADPALGARLLSGHDGRLDCLALAADGNVLITGGADGTARIWNLQVDDAEATARVVGRHASPLSCLAFSPDGNWLASGSQDEAVQLVNLQADDSATAVRSLGGHARGVRSLAFSPDSRRLVTSSVENELRLVDLTAPDSPPVKLERDVPDSPSETGEWTRDVRFLAFSSDGKWLATGGIFSATWLHRLDRPEARALPGRETGINCLTISPDSRWLAAGSTDQMARLWDLAAEDPAASVRVLAGHERSVTCVSISPDSHWLVTASADQTVRVWDLTAADPTLTCKVLPGHPAKLAAAAFSEDGHQLVTLSDDLAAQVWNVEAEDFSLANALSAGADQRQSCFAFSRQADRLIVGGDKSIRVWDLRSQGAAAGALALRGRQGAITSLAISPDGRWCVAGGADGTLQAWILSGDELLTRAFASAGRELTAGERQVYQIPAKFGARPPASQATRLPAILRDVLGRRR